MSEENRPVTRAKSIDVTTEIVDLPNGRRVEFDLVRHPGAAAVVPFMDDGRVLLIRQYRFATGGEILEIPAGKLDPGEAPEACATRELEEETGYRAGRLIELPGFYPTNGISAHYAHVYCALDCEEVGTLQLELSEQLTVRVFEPDDVGRLLDAGRIQDGFAVIGLSYYLRARAAGRLG